MPLLVAFVFAFGPAFLMALFVYWLDRYEKEPLILLGAAFFWGAIVAAGGAFLINTLLGVGIYLATGSSSLADLTTASLVAPFVEEALKGSALLLILLRFRSEFDSVLDGIVYAGTIGLGFAASENMLYLYDHGYLQHGWTGFWTLVFVRDVVVAWQHPFFTAFTGIGLAVARLSKGFLLKLGAATVGYAFAVFAHAFHNTLADLIGGVGGLAVGGLIDWFGWAMMAGFIVFMILRERALLKRQLVQEVERGVISAAQYERALSPLTMSTAFLVGGRSAARFYRLCGELAHKKEQLMRFGDEGGNTLLVTGLREQLTALGARVA
jgi:RsiW-degrading membrane proteinase PrsW (M82 family)